MGRAVREETHGMEVAGFVARLRMGVVIDLAARLAVEDPGFARIERPRLLGAASPGERHHRGAGPLDLLEQGGQLLDGRHGAP
ncbi:MAG TPA: hypothetical protein DCQ64_05880 [Candidatus Rokubacteria bacterium]|nr:hypothetical protein [Candidatus Rokubacteria bacterium]